MKVGISIFKTGMLHYRSKIETWWYGFIWRRFGWVKIRLPSSPHLYQLPYFDKECVRAAIMKELHGSIGFREEINDEFISQLAEGVLAGIERRSSLTIQDFLKKFHPEIIANRALVFQIVLGVVCYWEFEVLNLARKLEVNLYKNGSKDNETLSYRRLEDIIDGLLEAAPGVRLNLHQLRELRNSLLHSNFHQLIQKSSAFTKNGELQFDPHSIMMIRIKEPNPKPVSIFDFKEKDRFQEIDSHGWFLAAATSPLFEFLIAKFKESLNEIGSLITFHALSFEELEPLKEKVFSEGVLTEEDCAKFKAKHMSMSGADMLLNDVKNLLAEKKS